MKYQSKAIMLFAKITSGRFYTEAQKHRLSDLLARAERLNAEEKAAFESYVFDPRFDKIRSLTDCRNAYVLAVIASDDFDAEYYKNCIDVRTAVESHWKSKEGWIAFANSRDVTFANTIEGAFYAYAVGETERAKERFLSLAESNHVRSIRMLVALYEESGESALACEWLTVAKRIDETLFRETFDERAQSALDAYIAAGHRDVYEAACARDVDFFDADSFGGMQFTAGGKYFD